MPKFLIDALRDNGPAGESRHHLSIVSAADAAAAALIGAGLYPGQKLDFTPAADDAGPADDAGRGETSTNALDAAGFDAICGARDMLEDVAGMENSPEVVAHRVYRAAGELTRLFGLPAGPASERAAARISELQKRETARAVERGQLPPAAGDAPGSEQADVEQLRRDNEKGQGRAAVPSSVAAAAAVVEQLGPDAGIQSDEVTAATSPALAPVGVVGGNLADVEQLAPVAPALDPVSQAAAATVEQLTRAA